jgi:LysM repeat protein
MFGDTLESIANKYGITIDELIKINSNSDIKYGDFIVVPRNVSAFITYTIIEGDTLYSIASKYNVSVDSILALNGLNKDEYLYPGEVIIIPKSSINTYVVKEGDTILDVLRLASMDELMSKNSKIYLLPNQLIVY